MPALLVVAGLEVCRITGIGFGALEICLFLQCLECKVFCKGAALQAAGNIVHKNFHGISVCDDMICIKKENILLWCADNPGAEKWASVKQERFYKVF